MHSCVLAPGSEISETQLCAQYKIGKAPVRMALNRLAHDGLVRAIPRRGYRVTPVTVKDIHDVFELRLMLEPAAARMAAGKVGAQRLRALDELSRSVYEPGDPAAPRARSEQAFRSQLRATGNSRLAEAIEFARRRDAAPAPGARPCDRRRAVARAPRPRQGAARGDAGGRTHCREQTKPRSMVHPRY
jgi:DNA-binding GntR family transcriptional regulator